MIYNKISGSSINAYTSMLFKQFADEQCYLTFARAGETWGMCALISISLPPTAPTSDIFNKFVDLKSASYSTPDSTLVQLVVTDASVPDFDPNPDNYAPLTDPSIVNVNLYLDYINSTWCVIKNLPSNYRDFMSNSSGAKYYIINQSGDMTPTADAIRAAVKINVKGLANTTTVDEPVTLWVKSSLNSSDLVYLTGITRSVSTLGEISYTGLTDDMFTTTSAGADVRYANEAMATNGTYFYFTNAHNVKISGNLYMVPSNEPDTGNSIFTYAGSGNDHKFILFKTSRTTGDTTTDFFTKVSYASPANELAIYHETLPFIYSTSNAINTISDANPPGLDLSYITDPSINTSLTDVQGYVKITNTPADTLSNIYTKISYCKELMSTVEKAKFAGMGFTSNVADARHIESITMTTSSAVSRFGNVRPKPNGAPYRETDYALYMWSTNYVVGDRVTIKNDTSLTTPAEVTLTVTGVDYTNGFIIFGTLHPDGSATQQPIGMVVYPTADDSNLSASSQVVSAASNILNVIDFAVCTDMKTAMQYGMESVMVDAQIPANGPDLYNGVYRQIAVCCRPQYYDLTTSTLMNCVDSPAISFTESGAISLYYDGPQSTNHSWETGSVLYIANKNPVYRNYITGRESFKLII